MATQVPDYLQAVAALYSQAANEASRQSANEWLQNFQRTDGAWNVAITAIQAAPTDPQFPPGSPARLLAAQIVRHKVARDLYKLPEDHASQLRLTLLSVLSDNPYARLTAPMITQLCLALAEMAIHVPNWTNAVGDMAGRFTTSDELVPILLEFLTVLPQQLERAHKLLTHSEYTERSSDLLQANGANVFQMLLHYLDQASATAVADRRAKIFVCLDAWMETDSIPLHLVVQSNMITTAFGALGNAQMADAAASIIASIFEYATHDIRNMTQTGQAIVNAALPLLMQAAPAMIQEARDDEELAVVVIRLLRAACLGCMGRMIEDPVPFLPLLQHLLSVMEFPHLEALNPTFDVWMDLANDLLNEEDLVDDYGTPIGTDTGVDPAPFLPIFERLVTVLVHQMKYPPDAESAAWTAKEREDFGDFRYQMATLLKDCFAVLGPQRVLGQLVGMLGEVMQQQPAAIAASWQDAESVLAALRSVSRGSIELPEAAQYIHAVLTALPQLFPLHAKIRLAIMAVLGSYSPWMLNQPQFIAPAMGLVSQSFDPADSDLTRGAAKTLKYMSIDLKEKLNTYLPGLYPFYVSNLDTLPRDEAEDVVSAISTIIAHAPVEQMTELLHQFATPLIAQLDPATNNQRRIRSALNRLATMLKAVGMPVVHSQSGHPGLALVDALWPYLVQLLNVHGTDDTVTEGIAKVLRWSFGEELVKHYRAEQLERVIGLVESQYSATQFSCWQWVAIHILSNFVANLQWQSQLMHLVQTIALVTASKCSASGFDESWEQVDELHGILVSAVTSLPGPVLSWRPVMADFMRFTVTSLASSTNHRAVGSILVFINGVLNFAHPDCAERCRARGVDVAYLRNEVILPFGHVILLHTLAKRIVDCVHEDDHTTVIEIIKLLADIFPAEFPGWCEACLTGLSFLTDSERGTLLNLLRRVQPENSMSKVRDAVSKMYQLHRRREGQAPLDGDQRLQ
ncbi:armadillo-type protein [Blastocladiella britannica]|nr:armadillo-type protein [Blastocladiella britannica]